jgi:catalase
MKKPTPSFLRDAHTRCKFIGHVASANPLLEAAGIARKADEGFVLLDETGAAPGFVKSCRALRFWPRAAERKQP